MKRLIACGVILLGIAGLTLWSGHLLRTLEQDMQQGLDRLSAAAEQKNWQEAEHAAQDCIALLRKKQLLLAQFVSHYKLGELDVTLSALPGYAREQAPELRAETERARSQLRALCILFFRVI